MIRGLVLAFVVGFAVPSWATEITVASFNIRIFSTGSRDDTELDLPPSFEPTVMRVIWFFG